MTEKVTFVPYMTLTSDTTQHIMANIPFKSHGSVSCPGLLLACNFVVEYDLESDLDPLYDVDLKYWSTCYHECSLHVP